MEQLKNLNLKKFIQISMIWILIPVICIFLHNFGYFFIPIEEGTISDGILLYFLIVDMYKKTRNILKK